MPSTMMKDVRFAFRWLRRSPGFTAAALTCLAIGIGFNTALFSLVDSVLFRPLPVKSLDRLADVFMSAHDGDRYATFSYPDFHDICSRNAVFEDMLGFSPMITALNLTDRTRLLMGEIVTGNYFQMLGVRAAMGRTLLPEDDRSGAEPAVMVSDQYWRRDLGGDPQVVGRTVRLRGLRYTIVGVAPRGFTGMTPVLSAELWLPVVRLNEVDTAGVSESLPSPGTSMLDRRGDRWMFVKGRLKPGVTIAQAGANLASLMHELAAAFPQTNKDRHTSLLPTADVRIHPEASGVMIPAAAGLMTAVGLVLLIACANVASMLLARAAARRREIGIRLALGASRARLIRQFLTETGLLAFAGAAAGVMLAWWLIRIISTMEFPIPIPISLDLRIDARVLAFTSVLSIVAALAAGLAPALRGSRPDIVEDLRSADQIRLGTQRWSLSDLLVSGQIAVTLVLLVAAGLLLRSLVAAQGADVGFRARGLAIISADPAMLRYDENRSRQFWDQALARVRALPEVESAALARRLPFELGFSNARFFIPGYNMDRQEGEVIPHTRVSPDYFRVLGTPILEGRTFTEADTPKSPPVAIINETMARKYWPGQSPIGRRMYIRTPDGPSFEIVGVSADCKVFSVREGAQPYVIFSHAQGPSTYQVLFARTRGDAGRVLAGVRRELLALEPNLPIVQSRTMEAQVSATLIPDRSAALLVGAAALIGIVLAAVGLYGVISFSVARRTREIGIRMALGAGRAAVLGQVMRRGLLVAAGGLVVGMALALVLTRILRSVLYGVGPADLASWGAAVVILTAVSALATLIPAFRAANVNPSHAMRVE